MERFNTDKLKARIMERFDTQKAFAEALGIPDSTLSRYLTEGGNWRGSILIKAVRLLDIPDDEVDVYFFEPKVAKREPEGVKV